MAELKERFHFSKLMLSQARYLSALTDEIIREPSSTVSALYREIMEANGHSNIPRPINQAVFLQMAYISLVWLSESLTSEQRGNIRNKFSEKDFENAKLEGFAPNTNLNAYFRHIRNALAHASVDISGDQNLEFKFVGRNGEIMYLGSQDLGRISEKWILLVSNILYPINDLQEHQSTC